MLKQDSSRYWRKLIKLCRSLSSSVLEAAVVPGKLQLGKLYSLILVGEQVDYEKIVWCKTSRRLWQAVNKHLLTRDLLHYCHLNVPSLLCSVCAQVDESHSHILFDCIFSKMVMQKVYGWLGEVIWPEKFEDWLIWLAGRRRGWVYHVVAAALAATIYFLWLNRNHCCFDNSCFTVSKIDSLIRFSVKARALNINSRKFSSTERKMLDFVYCL
ncbi:uncharacterized protein LOC133792047 [Humulus lupulus]|uniref:uncharacterized protein LOC133792047 n=1 Tax=Humulus lupulus TaxID=3486 RepID=UPI002B405FD2|nr:uncharacterized protein LOC133792047 [Humulus lupulus]